MEEFSSEKVATARQERGYEVLISDIKQRVLEKDYIEALRIASLKYNDLNKIIHNDGESMTARELTAITDEIDDVRQLHDPLERLSEIAQQLGTEVEVGSQTVVDLTDEARLIREQLVLLTEND